MITARLQCFSAVLLVASTLALSAGELQPGRVHQLVFHDVDGNDLSTADGHVTIINVVTRENEEKARTVADQVPDKCVGDPKYRYVTLVNFQGKLFGPLRGITRAVIHRRLDGEAEKLRPQYKEKKIERDPRHDIYVVADFESAAVRELGLDPTAGEISVFVFNGRGNLVRSWKGVPPSGALATAIAAASE